jgi:transposase-like protein
MGRIKSRERKAEEKASMVLSLLRGEAKASELCRRYKVSEASLGKWRERFIAGGENALSKRGGGKSELEEENEQLKSALAEAVLKLEIQKKLQRSSG